MDCASRTSLEMRRWLVFGIALHNVVIPPLREKVRNMITPYYKFMVKSFRINSQTFEKHLGRISPEEKELNYKCINNNYNPSDPTSPLDPSKYDYNVRDEVSFAKLFMREPFMAQFSAFDDEFEASATLAVISGATVFQECVRRLARSLNRDGRRPWAHPSFPTWTDQHYNDCFEIMKCLVEKLTFPRHVDKKSILDKLRLWQIQGLEICLGKAVDDTLLRGLLNEVKELSDKFASCRETAEQNIQEIHNTLKLFRCEVHKALISLQKRQSNLEQTCREIERGVETFTERLSGVEKTVQEIKEGQADLRKTFTERLLRLEHLYQDIKEGQEDLRKTFTERLEHTSKRLEKLERIMIAEESRLEMFQIRRFNTQPPCSGVKEEKEQQEMPKSMKDAAGQELDAELYSRDLADQTRSLDEPETRKKGKAKKKKKHRR